MFIKSQNTLLVFDVKQEGFPEFNPKENNQSFDAIQGVDFLRTTVRGIREAGCSELGGRGTPVEVGRT